MDDDVYCLFIIFTSVLALVVPESAQALFAVVAFGLALVAGLSDGHGNPDGPARRNGHHAAER